MPYKGQTASKGGHSDFVKNPDIQKFLSDCEYLREPSLEEAQKMTSSFIDIDTLENDGQLPNCVISSDASKKDAPISNMLPSTQIGFIKVSHILIYLDEYSKLRTEKDSYVDPFEVAKIHKSASPLTFTLPGSNIRYKGSKSVKDGFRKAVYEQFMNNQSNSDNELLLANILLFLNDGVIYIGKTDSQEGRCPSCNCIHEFKFENIDIKKCPTCREEVYLTDWLRLHEDVSDFGSNTSAITRMMNTIEHLLLVTFIKQIYESNPRTLAKIAFFMDGPLAIFGQPAKLHSRIMKFLHQINTKLKELGEDSLLIIGLQKTGELMDYANMIGRYVGNNKLRVIDDEYRYKYIKGNDAPSQNFGNETYYGQDFILKTAGGKVFNFSIPYPFKEKSSQVSFSLEKTKLSNYGSLIKRACDLIAYFEMDLYENSIVPIAVAHRHASISIVPGGKVLDVLARTGLNK